MRLMYNKAAQALTMIGYIISIIRHHVCQDCKSATLRHYACKNATQGGVSPRGAGEIFIYRSHPSLFSQKRPLQLRVLNSFGWPIRYYDWRENCGESIKQFKEFEMGRKVFEFKNGDGRL